MIAPHRPPALKIFHLDGERGFRGGERQLLYLAEFLRARGHENTVVCRKASPLERRALDRNFAVMNLPFLFEWDPLSAALLRRRAGRTAGPVLFHAHTAHAAALALLASGAGGPPWVAHRRVDFPLANGRSARWKYRSAGAVFAVSRAVRAILTAQGMPPESIRTIPDSVPVGVEENSWGGWDRPLSPASQRERGQLRSAFAERWDAPERALWIGNLAALVPHKDQATLLRAMAALGRKRNDVRLFLIGDGPLRGELEELSRDCGAAPRVRFTGRQDDPAAWLKALDLFVLSSWGEGMGSVLLEAMSCGIPVVATAAGGIPEIVRHEDNGLLVPPREPELLAEAMDRLLRDPEGARRLAERALQGLERFGISRCAGEVEAVYRALLRETR